ncbi:MAG: CBS domain-containing protein, partial [Desulfobacterales bacterium]
MLIKDWMSESVFTVDVNDSMQHAMKLLQKHEIRMLPVMEKGKLVGVLSDRDIKKASASSATLLGTYDIHAIIEKIQIKEIMTRDPVTVPFDYTVEETAELIFLHKISGVPVVNHKGELVGIITLSDLCEVIFSLTGFGKKGIQFAIQMSDQSGSIKDITDLMRNYGGRVSSILTSYERVPS